MYSIMLQQQGPWNNYNSRTAKKKVACSKLEVYFGESVAIRKRKRQSRNRENGCSALVHDQSIIEKPT
jgi:hypothetical protein